MDDTNNNNTEDTQNQNQSGNEKQMCSKCGGSLRKENDKMICNTCGDETTA